MAGRVLSTEGNRKYPGRYHLVGDSGVLYAARREETAIRSFLRFAPAGRVRGGMAVAKIRIRLARVLDLTDSAVLRALALERRDLTAPDASLPRALGLAARRAGFEGLLAPSAAGPGAVVVVFRNDLGEGCLLEVEDVFFDGEAAAAMRARPNLPGRPPERAGESAAPARYLVTGGAGFIGSHLVEKLVAAGAGVRVLDDFSTGKRENLDPFLSSVELLEGSVADPELCRRACEGVDYVLHQAALASVQRSVDDPAASHEVNATGTLNLLVAAREAGVRRFVHAGSSSAYGDTPELPKREEMRPRPLSPYAVSKLAGENYCAAAFAVYGLQTVVLRYFNIFGPRQDPASIYSAVIPIFLMKAMRGENPSIHGDGRQTRDFTYVDNAVRANLLACRAPREAVAGRVFNVGCGERTSINRLWRSVRNLLGSEVEAEHAPSRPGDVRDSLADLTEIRKAMGYRVEVSFEEGLARTAAALASSAGARPARRDHEE